MYNTILTYLQQQGIQDAERHAEAIMKLLIQVQSLPPTPQYDIVRNTLRAVCVGFNVTVTGMMSNSKKQPLPMARHAYYYLCRYYHDTKVTLSDEAIAGVIDKDHASCQHGYKTVEAYLQTNDREFMGMWERTINNLT